MSEHTQGIDGKMLWEFDIDDDPVYEQLKTKVRRKVLRYRQCPCPYMTGKGD